MDAAQGLSPRAGTLVSASSSSASSLNTVKGFSRSEGTCHPCSEPNQSSPSLTPWLDPSPPRKECGCVNKGLGEAARGPFSQDPLMCHGLGATLRTSEPFRQRGHLSTRHPSQESTLEGPISAGVQPLSVSLSVWKHPEWAGWGRGGAAWLLLTAGPGSQLKSRAAEPMEGVIPAMALRFSLGPTDPDVSQISGAGWGLTGMHEGALRTLPSPIQRKCFGSACLAAIPCKVLGSQVKDFFCLRNFVTICVADRHRRPASRHPAWASLLRTDGYLCVHSGPVPTLGLFQGQELLAFAGAVSPHPGISCP